MRATPPFRRVGNYVPRGVTQCFPTFSACNLLSDPADSNGWRRAVRGSPGFSAHALAQTSRVAQTPPTAGDATGLPKPSPLVGGRHYPRCPGDVPSPKLRASSLNSDALFSPAVDSYTGGSPGA